MVGQRLQQYIQSCGLEAEDVPKVAVTFMTAKYSTWALFIAASVRLRPMRRLLMRPQPTPSPSWLRRQREMLHKAYERTKDRAKNRADAARESRAKRLSESRERIRYRVQAGIVEKTRRALDRAKQSNWYVRISSKYWQLSDKLADAASRSKFWSFVAASLRVQPKDLALGFAEGTILFKFTVLIHAPLELWLIVRVFKQKRALLNSAVPSELQPSVDPMVDGGSIASAVPEESSEQPESSEQLESSELSWLRRKFKRAIQVRAASRDAESLVRYSDRSE